MTARPPAPALSSLADVTDERFTDEQRARVARFDAAVVPVEGWEQRVEAAARAIERSLDSADPNDWMPRALAAAALTADAALAGQHAHDWVKARTNGREWLECRSCRERRYDLDEVAREFGVDLSERAPAPHAEEGQ